MQKSLKFLITTFNSESHIQIPDLKHAMKTVLLSPQSTKPMNRIFMEDHNRFDDREERENNYFHGCRKDANCDCKMCLDSISATLDLMSMSVQRSSLTKLSASKPCVAITPVSIDPTLLSTPNSTTSSPVVRVHSSKPAFKSTEKASFLKNDDVKKKELGFKLKFLRWVLLLGLILGFELGFSRGIFWVLQPRLSDQIVRDVVEEFSNVGDFDERLNLIQQSLNNSVNGEVSSCNHWDSTWRINQDGLILMSYCSLYKSEAEEVWIWGWPLETGGLLTAKISPRWFNVLSGRIKEWPEGKIKLVVREASTEWMLRKGSSSVVHFGQNTWIIEYRRSSLLENPSILRLVMAFIKLKILKFMDKIQQQFLLLPKFKYYTASNLQATGFNIPT